MTPYFEDTGLKIYHGDALTVLAGLPDCSVHCVVTSPPYWGLRDYGVEGQLGLEASPWEYIENMVQVFREVKRVLRNDGTCWVNMGDSYAGSRAGHEGFGTSTLEGNRENQRQANSAARARRNKDLDPKRGKAAVGQPYRAVTCSRRRDDHEIPRSDVRIPELKPKDLVGMPWRLAFALQQPYVDWRIKTEAMRAWVAGLVDGEGCITILRTKSSHSDSLSYPPVVQIRMCDLEPLDRLVAVAGSSYGSPQSPPSASNQRDSYQWKVVSESAAKIIAEIYPYLTCKRKQAIVAYNHQLFRSGRGNQERKAGDLEREQFCKELINKLNQRQPVDIPSWMVEPKVQVEKGWYLRQDLIWHKPNPMPESVRDRCTKAHEYIFLLSKSERYFYNWKAVLEPATGNAHPRGHGVNPKAVAGWQTGPGSHKPVEFAKTDGNRHGKLLQAPRNKQNPSFSAAIMETVDERNKRSVWSVVTESFDEAHFATFPRELVKPCILAGCPEKGIVLDPFAGSCTTLLVAQELQCQGWGIELSLDYIDLALRARLPQRVMNFAGD